MSTPGNLNYGEPDPLTEKGKDVWRKATIVGNSAKRSFKNGEEGLSYFLIRKREMKKEEGRKNLRPKFPED